MKTLRKIALLVLAAVFAMGGFSLSSAAPAEAAPASGKTLVAYFSASGNTENVAEQIADITGGDLFEITPATPYTTADLDWTDENSRVNREHQDPSLQDIALTQTTPDNFDSYTTVFIGYPIWWGNASWVVNNFVKDNNFTGKTVIPFCTSSSSPIGESGINLRNMAGTGTWLDGQRFSRASSSEDIRSWVESLNLPSTDAVPSGTGFSDVDNNAYYADAVAWGVQNGIVSGTSASAFTPDRNVTRSEFVTFLWRLAGKPAAGTSSFNDISDQSSDFRSAINWAAGQGIAEGRTENTFDPSGLVTREQAAAFLYRYENGNASSETSHFDDVRTGEWYTAAINWGAANNVISGYSSRLFGIGNNATRAAAITFIYRAENNG